MTPATTGALLADVRTTLSRWVAPTTRQATLRDQYLQHLVADPDGLWRAGPPVHLTASCFVLDPDAGRTLLTLHRKGGFWVQFGGHLEPGDTTLSGAALREAREESGLDPDRPGNSLQLVGDEPLDLDRHRLSSSFGRCQEHLDVAYVAIASPDALVEVSDESDDVAWWPVGALPAEVVSDLPPRLARAVEAVRSHQG